MYSAQAVIEKVMSFHSSRQSLSQSAGSGSALNMTTGSGGTAGRGRPQQYSPTNAPIREESREAVTRKNDEQSPAAADDDDDDDETPRPREYLVRRHTLRDLPDLSEFLQKRATVTEASTMATRAQLVWESESPAPDKATREINANPN